MITAKLKSLNYTESWLFCATIIFKANLKKLSFYQLEPPQYSDYFYQQGLETISSHQKLDRQLLKDNQSVIWIESTWYFFYKLFTRLQSEYPTEHGEIVWKALDYDYTNFNLGINSIVEGQENIIQVATEIPNFGIKTFFYPEMINDYWMTRIDRRLTIGASIIILIFLGLAYLMNFDSEWIRFLLVILTCFYVYHLIVDLMMQEFNRFNFVFQGLLILVIAFYYCIVS